MEDELEDVRMKRKVPRENYLCEFFNLVFVLRGNVEVLEQIKRVIAEQYVSKGLVKLIKPIYSKEKLFIVTESQWKEYNNLKNEKLSRR